MYLKRLLEWLNYKLYYQVCYANMIEMATYPLLKLPHVVFHQGNTDGSKGHNDYQNDSALGGYHYHHGLPAHLHPNGVCPYASSATFQVIDITSNSIMLDVKNMKNKVIIVYEVAYMEKNLAPSNGTLVTSKYFDINNTTYLIDSLKPFTCYNITIFDKKEQVVLDLPILTFYDFDNAMSKYEYETTYKEQFDLSTYPGLMPLSWSQGRDIRAEVSNWSFYSSTFYVRGEPINVSSDGINDRNKCDEVYWHSDIKRFYFPALGIHVYECPFKPGYFHTNSSLAILGKTQCFVEAGICKKHLTLGDLDALDDKHKFDIIWDAVFDSSTIMISATLDTITIFSFGVDLIAVRSAEKLLKGIFDVIWGLFKPNGWSLGAVAYSNAGGYVVEGTVPFKDSNEFLIWLRDNFVPGFGTIAAIRHATAVHSNIQGFFIDN